MPKEKIRNLGMPQDRQQRRTRSRVDTLQRRAKVTSARKLLYDGGYRVGSSAVENILKEDSLVPNQVKLLALATFLDY